MDKIKGKKRKRSYQEELNKQNFKDGILSNLAVSCLDIDRYLDDDADCREIYDFLVPKLVKLGRLEMTDDGEAENVLDFRKAFEKKIMFSDLDE